MSTIASQITSLTIVYSIVYLRADERKHQSSAILAFVRGIHRRPVNSPHKGPVTRKMFPIDDVIMRNTYIVRRTHSSHCIVFYWLCWGCQAILPNFINESSPLFKFDGNFILLSSKLYGVFAINFSDGTINVLSWHIQNFVQWSYTKTDFPFELRRHNR